MIALTDAPTLNIANVDGSQLNYTSFGLGGLYPAIKTAPRDDGLAARVEDVANAGGVAAVFLSTGFFSGGSTSADWAAPCGSIRPSSSRLPSVPFRLRRRTCSKRCLPRPVFSPQRRVRR